MYTRSGKNQPLHNRSFVKKNFTSKQVRDFGVTNRQKS